MRLGGPVFGQFGDPDRWVAAHRAKGYGAALCPLNDPGDGDAVRAYRSAAEQGGLVIAEVGAWSNPLSPDEGERQAALALCRERLALADMIGARCCVNIAGSCGPKWDGPYPQDLTAATFDLIVESVRSIIDAVQPTRTFYTLETMPWMYPDSAASYLRLLEAVDRLRFGVHLDPVNVVNSPRRYFENGALLRECFEKLGPHIKSCHAKDVRLGDGLTVHLDEVRPGAGGLDYKVFLRELDRLDADMPLILEHLAAEEDYDRAAAYVREVADELGVSVRQ